jgi:DNA-binding NarL/FixJ family response regulator
MGQGTVLMMVNDLFFSERIERTLGAAGYRVVGATADQVEAVLRAEQPGLVIIDLAAFAAFGGDVGDGGERFTPPEWEEAIRTVRAVAPGVPVLGFGSHMDVAARERALQAGASRVVAKSQFVEGMVGLVERYFKGAPAGEED